MNFFLIKLNGGDQFQLVKGCPTDWNGDGRNNDDYSHDGQTDQDDHDYYDGYMDGYYSPDDPDDIMSEAWAAGRENGSREVDDLCGGRGDAHILNRADDFSAFTNY